MESVLNRAYVTRMAMESEGAVQSRAAAAEAALLPSAPTGKPPEDRRKMGPNQRIDGAFEEAVRAREELRQRIDAHNAAQVAWDQTRQTLETQIEEIRRKAHDESTRANERLTAERTAWERDRGELEAALAARTDELAAAAKAHEELHAARATIAARSGLESRIEWLESAASDQAELEVTLADVRRRLREAEDGRAAEREASEASQRGFEERISQLEAEAAAREKDLEAAARARAALQATADRLSAELGDAAEWLAAEKKAETSARAFETLTRDLENSERERRRLDERLVEAHAEHARLGAAHRVLEIQLSDAVGRAERAHEEMNAWRARVETLSDGAGRAAVQEQSRQADRVGEVGRLVETMAPDLETLIGSIDALGSQLCSELTLSSPHRQAAEVLAGRTSETRAMLHQLASFSRRQARPVRAIDLNDVITRSENTLIRLCGADVDLQLRLTPVAHVAAVEEEVEQLVASLVFNARELLTAGGSLALVTTAADEGVPETSREDVGRRAAPDVRLAVTATAYGVLPAVVSPALDLLTRRCGGEITRQGEPGRMAGYSLDFPSMY